MKRASIPLIFFVLLSNFSFSKTLLLNNNTIIVSGISSALESGDSIGINFVKYGINSEKKFIIQEGHRCSSSDFKFKLKDAKEPMIVSVIRYRHGKVIGAVIGGTLIEPGDSIYIKEQNTVSGKSIYSYGGKGKVKFDCEQYLDDRYTIFHKAYPHFTLIDQNRVRGLDSLCTKNIDYLQEHKPMLSKIAFNYLKASVLIQCETEKYQALNLLRKKSNIPFQNKTFQKLILDIAKDPGTRAELFGGLYYFYISKKFEYDSVIAAKKQFDLYGKYSSIKNSYSGKVREQIVTQLILNSKATELSVIISDALTYMENNNFREILLKIKAEVGINESALDFLLYDSSNIPHHLRDFKDSVVVLDFLFTGCINCRKLKPFMDTIEKKYENQKVKFITVSIDEDIDVWKKTLQEGKYTTPLSLNLFTGGKGQDDPLIKRYNVRDYPTILIIDKNGRNAETPEDPRTDNGRHFMSILDKLLTTR